MEAVLDQKDLQPSKQKRTPDYEGWSELHADLLKGHVKGRWWGDVPAVVVLTTVAITGLLFKDYAYFTVPLAHITGLVAIFLLRHRNYERDISNPAESGGQPRGQDKNRAPPVSD